MKKRIHTKIDYYFLVLGNCYDGDVTRYDGEMWKSTEAACEYCLCSKREITCQPVTCEKCREKKEINLVRNIAFLDENRSQVM